MQAPKAQSNYQPAPAGNHVARLYRIINIGTVEEEYMGKSKMVSKIMLTFELCNEKKSFKEGDEPLPLSVSREYTFSMAPKANLRALVEGIIGVALEDEEADHFDVEKLLGKACLLNVVHKKSNAGRMYALIQSASPLPKGMEAPEQENKSLIFGHGKDWNDTAFEFFNDFLKDKIRASGEYKAKMGIEDARENGVESVEEEMVDKSEFPF